MKRLLLTWVSALTLAASVMAQEQVVTQTTVQDGETYVTHFLYDSQARPILYLTDGLSQQLFFYDEAGQMVRQEYTDFTNSNLSRIHVYTYNEVGQQATVEEFIGERSLGVTTFTYDEHGNIITMLNSRGGMPIPRRNTYDEAGQLVKVEMLHPRDPKVVMSTTEYSYENGLLMKEVNSSGESITSIISYTYNEAGLRIKSVTMTAPTEEQPEGEVVSTTTYAYADIDAAFAPYNVIAIANEGNTVTLTWEGTANSVVVDGKFYTVEGNSFTTPVLLDGTYDIYVCNNGNAVMSEPVDVVDNSKVGVSDVRLDGEITATTIVEQDYYGEEKEVMVYNIPVAWTLPDGAKPIGYRIYYNSYYYVDVEDGTLRSYVIPAKNVKNWSMATQSEVTLDFAIRVVAIYETGEMEPANVLELDTEAILALAGVHNAQADAQKVEVYTLDGIRMPSANGLHPGTYVVRYGKQVRKVQTR